MTNQSTYSASSLGLHGIAPTVSLVAITSSVLLIVVLHIIKPDLDPSWRMLSEYSLGAYGWIMKVAFWLMAVSNIALAFALQSNVRNVASKIGIALHYVVGLALLGAGLFDMDPITAKPEQLTAHGQLHGISAMIGIPGQVVAAVLLAWGTTRLVEEPLRSVAMRSGAIYVGSAVATGLTLLIGLALWLG